METTSTYFTRRARQERTSAVVAASSEARSAHLELALRLVKCATEPSALNFGAPIADNDHEAQEVGVALHQAFPVPGYSAFQKLLAAVDRSDRSK